MTIVTKAEARVSTYIKTRTVAAQLEQIRHDGRDYLLSICSVPRVIIVLLIDDNCRFIVLVGY